MKNGDNAIQLNQSRLVTAIMDAVVKQAQRGGITIYVIARQQNAILKAADAIVKEFAIGYKESVPGAGVQQWVESDDTGMSSRFMAAKLCGATDVAYAYPHDPSDFDLCAKLWAAATETQKADMVLRKPILAESGPHWKLLIAQWDELLALHEAGNTEQLARKLDRIARAK